LYAQSDAMVDAIEQASNLLMEHQHQKAISVPFNNVYCR